MKKIILLLFLCAIHYSFAQTARQLENLEVFNKLYGYVKYFHPSDEAAALNWDKFAAYGSREVEKCNNVEELHRTLLALFEPIAPSIQIFAGKEESFTIKSLTPPDTAGFKVVTWQHLGLGLGHPKNIYSSVRTNRKSMLSNDRAFSTITAAVEMEKYRNKEFRLTGSVRLIGRTRYSAVMGTYRQAQSKSWIF